MSSGFHDAHLLICIFLGADWLQGPYVYSLYKDQYGFSERMVAVFFVIGFLSAGIAAPVVGAWADQQYVLISSPNTTQKNLVRSGRRKLCLVFCVTYTISCICISIPYVPILFIGRLLGGFSTSILFSSFETWLISSSNAAGLPSADMSNIMGRATLINGIVATTAGVVSNQLVGITRNFLSPFFASGALLVLAWYIIRRQWSENYGSQGAIDRDVFQVKRLGQAWNIVRKGALFIAYTGTQSHFKTLPKTLSSSFSDSLKHVSKDQCTSSSSFGFPHSKNTPTNPTSPLDTYSPPS